MSGVTVLTKEEMDANASASNPNNSGLNTPTPLSTPNSDTTLANANDPTISLRSRSNFTAELSGKVINPDILLSRMLNSGVISKAEMQNLQSKSPEEKLKAIQEIEKSDASLKAALRLGSELHIVPSPLDMRIRHASNTVTYDLPKGSALIRFSLEERNLRAKEIETLSAFVKDGVISADEAKALIADSSNLQARTSRLEKYKEIVENIKNKSLTTEAASLMLKGLIQNNVTPSSLPPSNSTNKPIVDSKPNTKIPPIVEIVVTKAPENKGPKIISSPTKASTEPAKIKIKDSDYLFTNSVSSGTALASLPKAELDAKILNFHELITKELLTRDPVLVSGLKGIPIKFQFHPDLNKIGKSQPDTHRQGLSESNFENDKLVSATVFLNPAILDDPAKAFLTVHHELTHIARNRTKSKDTELVEEQKTCQHSLGFLKIFASVIDDKNYYNRFLDLLAEEDYRLKNDVPRLYKP